MELDSSQIKSKKVIGRCGSNKVFAIETMGGWSMVIVAKAAGFETRGAGSHPAIARYIAKKKEPDIEYTELSKSEERPLSSFEKYLPEWEAFTDKIIALQNK